jgi:hypothetical protein
MTNKIAIVTALSGKRDNFCQPSIIHNNADYYAFVDNPLNIGIWKQIKNCNFSTDKIYSNRRNAKIYKIIPQLFLPNYEYFFWVDVTHDVIENPQNIIDQYLNEFDIAVFNHSDRNCVYDEAEAIKRIGKDNNDLVDRQMNFYKEEGFPKGYGLFELPSFVRKNNHRMNEMSLCWWEQISKYSSRDQLSLPYVFWKMNINKSIMPGLANGWNVKHLQSNLIKQTRDKIG